MSLFDNIFNSQEGRLGLGLLAAAGPRADGAGLWQRVMDGVGSMDNWQAGQLKNKYTQGQIDDQASQAEYRKAQAAESAWKIGQSQEEMKRRQTGLDDFMKELAGPPPSVGSAIGKGEADAIQARPSPGNEPGQGGWLDGAGNDPVADPKPITPTQVTGAADGTGNLPFDPRLIPLIRSGMAPKDVQEYANTFGLSRPEVARTVKGTGPDGREYEYQVDKFGRPVAAGLPQYHEPFKIDRGSSMDLVAPDTAQTIRSFPAVVTPRPTTRVPSGQGNQAVIDAVNKGISDLRQQDELRAQQQIRMGQLSNLGVAIGTLDQLANHPGLNGNTGASGVFPNFPGSEADTFKKGLQTFKSQSFLPILENLKTSGLVTAEEADKFLKDVGALDPGVGPEAFRQSVSGVAKNLQAVRDRVPTPAYPIPIAQDIIDLKMSPKRASEFDSKFGPGAAEKILKGN